MTVQYVLREDAAELDRQDASLTERIADAEAKIVDLRRQRDDLRFHRAEMLAAAHALDSLGFTVERNDAGIITVSVDPKP